MFNSECFHHLPPAFSQACFSSVGMEKGKLYLVDTVGQPHVSDGEVFVCFLFHAIVSPYPLFCSSMVSITQGQLRSRNW